MLSCRYRDGLVWAVVLSPAFVSGQQLVAALRALERSTPFPPGTGLLLDARAVSHDARGHTASELATTVLELGHLGIGRCAVVPTPARVRQAEKFVEAASSDSIPMALFLKPDAAVHWLRTGNREEASA